MKTPPDSFPLRLVAIGGGTGLSTLLHGLKRHVFASPMDLLLDRHPAGPYIAGLTAVVTVTDDGGSSGRLRRELRVLPPGDIRNCLVALSEDEALISRLFQYRFSRGRGLKGHSFGNLFLAALTRITGDMTEAVKISSEVLAIRGRIVPATTKNVILQADLTDGRRVSGESRIAKAHGRITRIRLVPANCEPLPETLSALASADVITLGPGSLFTSLIPNLLVKGIAEAIATSRAVKVFIGNLMTQPGETVHFTASDHINAIYAHCGRRLFDYAVINTGTIPRLAFRRYEKQHAEPVTNDIEKISAMGIRVVTADLVSPASEGKFVRHNAERAADLILGLGHRKVQSSKFKVV